MATPDNSAGVTQYIRLMLEPGSVKAISEEAAAAAKAAGEQIAAALGKQGTTLDKFYEKVAALRAEYEKAALANRKNNDPTTIEFRQKAEDVAKTFQTGLNEALKGLPRQFQEAIRFALQASSQEMHGARPRQLAEQFSKNIAEGMKLTRGEVEAAGKATAEAAAKGLTLLTGTAKKAGKKIAKDLTEGMDEGMKIHAAEMMKRARETAYVVRVHGETDEYQIGKEERQLYFDQNKFNPEQIKKLKAIYKQELDRLNKITIEELIKLRDAAVKEAYKVPEGIVTALHDPKLVKQLESEGDFVTAAMVKKGQLKKGGEQVGQQIAEGIQAGVKKGLGSTPVTPLPGATGPQLGPALPPGWNSRLNVGIGPVGILDKLTANLKEAIPEVKTFVREWTSFVKLPPPKALDPVMDRKIFKDAKGDVVKYAQAVQQARLENQLSGASFTKLGQVLKKLGVDDLTKYSQGIQDVVHNLKQIEKGSSDAAPPTTILGKALGTAGDGAKYLLKQLGGIYAAYQVFGFFKKAVEDSNEMEVSMVRLSVSLGDVGIKLSDVRGRVDQAIKSGMQFGFTAKDVVDALSTLVQLTGDYKRSFEALPSVLDIVRARHVDLEVAAKMTAKAMTGNTQAIAMFTGIVLDRNRDVLQQFQEMMGREAQSQADTFGMEVKALGAAFFNLKVAIGNALKEGLGGKSALDQLIETIENLTKWVNENKATIQVWGTALASIGAVLIWLGKRFGELFALIEGPFIMLMGLFEQIPDTLQYMWDKLLLSQYKWAKLAVVIFDKVFRTGFTASMKEWERQHRESLERAEANIKERGKRIGAALDANYANLPFGVKSPPSPDTSVPDFPGGVGGPRQFNPQALLSRNVSQLFAVMIHGDLDKAAVAADQLNKILEEQKQRVEALSQSAESRQANAKQIRETEAEIAIIEGKQLAYQNRLKKIEEDKAELAAMNHRIELLTQVALKGDAEQRMRALNELDKMHDKVLKKQAGIPIDSDKYFALQEMLDKIEAVQPKLAENEQKILDKQLQQLKVQAMHGVTVEERAKAMEDLNKMEDMYLAKQKLVRVGTDEWVAAQVRIDDIEQIKLEALNAQNKSIEDQIKLYGKLVDYDEYREEATKQLHRLHDQTQKQLDDQVRLLKQQNDEHKDTAKTLEEIARLEERLRQIDAAEANVFEAEDKKIQMFEDMLKNAKTHDEGFNRLAAERTHLINLINKEGAATKDIVQWKERLKRVNQDLDDDVPQQIRDIENLLKLADTLKGTLPRAQTTTTGARAGGIEEQPPEMVDGVVVGRKAKVIIGRDGTVKTSTTQGKGTFEDREEALKDYKKVLEQARAELEKHVDAEGNINIKEEDRLRLMKAIARAIQGIHDLEEPSLNLVGRLVDAWQHDWPQAVEGAASQMETTMMDFFSKMGVSVKSLKKDLQNLPKGLAAAMLSELKQVALEEGKKDLAYALRETALGFGSTAMGNFGAAAEHFKSAAGHYAASVAWAALGGAAGGGAGGGGAAAPNLNGNTGTSADNNGAPATIYIKGGVLSTDDVEQMDALAKAIQAVGGRSVVVSRG